MVKRLELSKVKISDVKVDSSNPNKMSTSQFEALKKSITKFGNIVPLILDKKLKIADGQHRYEAFKELGYKEVPAYILDISDPDRRLLRQIMNKLKGMHDYSLDSKDFKVLCDAYNTVDVAGYLGVSEGSVQKYLYVEEMGTLPDVDISGEVVDLKDVLIIQFENTGHAKSIRDFFGIAEKKKSVKSGELLAVIKSKQ